MFFFWGGGGGGYFSSGYCIYAATRDVPQPSSAHITNTMHSWQNVTRCRDGMNAEEVGHKKSNLGAG